MKIGALKHHCVRLVRRSWLPVALLIGAPLTLPGPIPVSGQQTAVQNLTLSQIEELVMHGVPDSTMSTQIERRGISFSPTSAILDSLRVKGAGPLTLAAISRAHQPAASSHETGSSATGPRRAPKLTQAQLQHLIRIRASDAFIAEQVQSRGVGFPATEAEVSSFGNIGAGPQTITALRDLVQTGSVQIHTEPGAAVTLDGKAAGQADSAGLLSLQDVLPGEHTLMLNKDGFHPAQQSFTLGDREARQLSAPLAWAGGLLTVSAQPAFAAVSVTGPASFSEALNAVRCPPGAYTVTFSAHGYVNQTRTFQIAAGEHHAERAQLEVDPAYIAGRLADANTKLGVGNPPGAIEDAHEILKLNPADVKAEAILAEASFQTGDMNTFVNSGNGAIRNGEAVTVMLMHVHNFPRRMVHSATITISNSGIDVVATPAIKGCKIPPSILFSQITQAQVQRDQTGAMELHISYLSKPPEKTRFIGSLHDLDFVVEGSAVVNQPGTIVVLGGENTPIQSSQNAAQLLQGVANLILTLKG
jgi:hypothetical protein